MSDYADGYNEYLERTVDDADLLSPSKNVVQVGSNLSSGGQGALNTVLVSAGAPDSGKIAALNVAGIHDQSFSYSPIYEAGENLAAMDALYISGGKVYKAWDAQRNLFVGFAKTAAYTGDMITVYPGPVVDGFTSLVAGGTYYLHNSSNKGKIVYTMKLAYGGSGAAVGVAINTTAIQVAYSSVIRFVNGEYTFAVPAVGATSTNSGLSGWPTSYWGGTIYMEASDSAGGNTAYATYNFIAYKTKHIFTKINSAGAVTMGTATAMEVAPSAGTNTSTLKFTEDAGGGTGGPVITLSNTLLAGTGSTQGTAVLHYWCFG